MPYRLPTAEQATKQSHEQGKKGRQVDCKERQPL
jgi:hypothetical protein